MKRRILQSLDFKATSKATRKYHRVVRVLGKGKKYDHDENIEKERDILYNGDRELRESQRRHYENAVKYYNSVIKSLKEALEENEIIKKGGQIE